MPGSVSSSALPLHEFARLTGPMAMRYVASVYGEDGVLKHLNFKTDAQLTQNIIQLRNAGLGTINYRKLNEQSVAFQAATAKVTAEVSIPSNFIAVDQKMSKAWERSKIGPSPLQVQFDAHAKALQISSSTLFFNNDPTGSAASSYITSDVDGPTGLWFKLQPSGSSLRQPDFYDLSSQMVVDAGEGSTGPDLSGTPSAANAMFFLAMLETALFRMNGGLEKPRKAFMDFKLLRQLKRGLGSAQLFSVDKDQFGRKITRYYGCELVPLGVMADGSTPIISTTENAAGTLLTGSTYTSVYIVDPAEDGLCAWQTNAIAPEKLPKNGTSDEYLVDWAWGTIPASDRAVSRLYNIKVA